MTQLSLKVGHYRPNSETPFYGVSLAGRSWPNNECWLCSFVTFQGAGILTSIAKKPNMFVILQGGLDPLPPLDPRMDPRMEPGQMALSGAY